MALMTCMGCEKQYSDCAPQCPNCGKENQFYKPTIVMEESKSISIKPLLWIECGITALLIAFLIGVIIYI